MNYPARTVPVRAVVLLGIIIAFALPGVALAQNPHIDLKIEVNGGVAKLQFENSECPSRPNDKGCVLMRQGSQNWVSWELDQDSWQSGWRLNNLDFSPDGSHWGDSGHPLSNCTASAFQLTANDMVTGHASTAEVRANGKRMRVWNENDNAPGTICITHYKLSAVNENTGMNADSDPVIDNRGRN